MFEAVKNRVLVERKMENINLWRLPQIILSEGVFPGAVMVKNPPAKVGDVRNTSPIPGSGRFPGEGQGNPLHYSCLENPIDRGAWRAP